MPYPTVPGRRMAWDADGTLWLRGRQDGGEPVAQFSAAEKAEANDEDETAVNVGYEGPNRFLWWIRPELAEFDGIFYAYGDNARPSTVHTSPDTTHGYDGTWTQQVSDLPDYTVVNINYRTGITSLAVSNQRAIRVAIQYPGSSNDQLVLACHLYGEISAGQTPDRLLFVDATTGLEFGLPIDYGDTPRGAEIDQTFKLKNNSASLTASAVQITGESLYRNSGAWYTFSEGGAFQATLPLAASIGPGASSPTITVRRNIPDAETLGLHAGRIRVSPPTWT